MCILTVSSNTPETKYPIFKLVPHRLLPQTKLMASTTAYSLIISTQGQFLSLHIPLNSLPKYSHSAT